MLRAGLFAFLAFSAMLLASGPEAATPDVLWTPNTLTEVVEIGGGKSVSVTFTVTDDFDEIKVTVVPELQDLVQTIPSSFSDVAEGETRSLTVVLAASLEEQPGLLEGAIILRSGGRVFSRALGRPLPVTLDIREDTGAPSLEILEPPNFSLFGDSPITVVGTVSDDAVGVEVNGVPVTLNAVSWTATVPIEEGNNIITAAATDQMGNVATASIQATLDTQPPMVTIDSPPDGFVTNEPSISVAGMINDIVVGTVNGDQARVTVNDIEAAVANRSYLVVGVPLVPGPNTITAIGEDQVGNVGSDDITVIFEEVTEALHIELISGNNQEGPVGSQLPGSLVAALVDGQGSPVPGEFVIFKVTENNGTLSDGVRSEVRSVAVTTDAQGEAAAEWVLGTRAGAGNNMVEATAVGFAGAALYTATALPSAADKINVDAGNNQTGVVDEPLPSPFVAVVTDAGHNRLGNVPVTFTVTEGGGDFEGQPAITVNTDSDGRALAVLRLGSQEGFDNNVVAANFLGNAGFPAAFVASGLTAGDPADTTISGVVLDNSNIPVPGVTMRIEGTILLTQTDLEGQFVIQPAPVGHVKLLADGSTADRPGTWPSLEFDLVTVPGRGNTVGMPIFLLPLDLSNALFVDETTGGTLTLPEVPGFSLTVEPGSATFPDGSRSGLVSVTVVHADKIPMVPNFGQQPRFIVTIQPAGVLFDPPAPITIPNLDGLPPGQVTELYSFDHDLGQFVSIGTGTVSEDGTVVASDPGVGIIKGGWHCGGDPSTIGTVADCPDCQSCQGPPVGSPGGSCEIDDSSKPPEKCASCSGGKPVPPKSAEECCAEITPGGGTLGYVVCCNTSHTACVDQDKVAAQLLALRIGGSVTTRIAIDSCIIKHEEEHFNETRDCPLGAFECLTSRPFVKDPSQLAQNECNAHKAEVTCLQGINCGVDLDCALSIPIWIAFTKSQGNDWVSTCF